MASVNGIGRDVIRANGIGRYVVRENGVVGDMGGRNRVRSNKR